MRAFIAVPLPEELKVGMTKLQREVAHCGVTARWVGLDHMHLTLVFMEEVAPELATKIQAGIVPICRRYQPMKLSAERVGAFPDWRRPRVFWVGLEGDVTPLLNLQKEFKEMIHSFQVRMDDKCFKPHLTLGRTKADAPPRAITLPNHLVDTRLGQFALTDVIFFESQLRPSGPQYHALFHCTLGHK